MVLTLLACGSPDPETLRSEHTPPTVELSAPVPADQEIVWSDLEAVFPTQPAALPVLLAELRPGLDGGRALAILEGAHQPGIKIFTDQVGETLALASTLKDTTNVGVTLLMLDGKTLGAIDVSLPDELAIPMLTTRWGAPTAVEHEDGGKAIYRWVVAGEPWTAALHSEPGGKAILKYSPS